MDIPDSPIWSLYLLRCADNSLYTGITTDVERRIATHRKGARGAKYLQGRGPFELVFSQEIGDRSQASRVEHQVKQLPKSEKERLLSKPHRFRERIAGLAVGET